MIATLLVTALLQRAPPPKRPNVDLSAMHEAMGSATDRAAYASAASYAHFLSARLQHHGGNHLQAQDDLRLALASDDSNPYLMTALAEQFARGTELERAEAQLKRVLERYPDYARAQLLMGRVLFEAQKTARARVHLVRAMKLRPTDPDAYLVLTQLCLDEDRVDEAVKVVEALGSAVPGEPIGFHRLGLALAARGDDARAERLLRRAAERDPGDVAAWAALARIEEAHGQLPQALEHWERAIAREPENREWLLSAGRLSLRLARLAEARGWFERLLALGREPEWAVKVAFSYLSTHRLDEAVAVLDTARIGTREPRLHFYAGLVHERLFAWQRAAEAFGQVPSGSGDLFHEAQMHRAACLSGLGDHRQALALLEQLTVEAPTLAGLDLARARALERAGRTREAEVVLGRAFAGAASPTTEQLNAVTGFYQRQGRLADAIALMGAALVKHPGDETLLSALAIAHDKQGDWRKALQKMRALLESNPTNAGAANFVGYLLAEHGQDLDEAQQLVLRALEVRPDSGAFLDSMGWVLYRRGEPERAVEYLERAVEAAPDEATILEHLGEVSTKLGRRARAVEAFRRAFEIVRTNPEAADRPTQREDLERKLKLLTPGVPTR